MTVSDQIIAVLDDLSRRFGIAIDWSSQNILPYVEELCGKYIKYEICTSIAWCVIMGVVLIVALVATKIAYKADIDDLYIPATIATCFIVGFFLFVVTVQTFDIIECLTIPEKTLIEFATGLMRQN